MKNSEWKKRQMKKTRRQGAAGTALAAKMLCRLHTVLAPTKVVWGVLLQTFKNFALSIL